MWLEFYHQQGQFELSVAVEIPDRGLTALFGPSGCGKTTLLRCMAGLEKPDQGRFECFGCQYQESGRGRFLPPHKRPFGLVFQEANLFSHMSVQKNLLYGFRRTPHDQRRFSVAEISSLLGIESLFNRMPDYLSGGERQRVAIARALLCSPGLLLMDEPLSALDMRSKQRILPFLERIRDTLDLPIIYVSHSLPEVKRLADHLVIMESGKVSASGSLNDMVTRTDLSLIEDEDAGVTLCARVASHDSFYNLVELQCDAGALWLPMVDAPVGSEVRVSIDARDITLSVGENVRTSSLNCFSAEVIAIHEFSPGMCMVHLRAGSWNLLSKITSRSRDALGIRKGGKVFASIKSAALI
jgi:molybdate transport system ATP-binding protein